MFIVDTFPFNKDFNTLEIRLNELWDIVDKFIVVESSYTHSGLKKPLYLKDKFMSYKKYHSKLMLISSTKKIFTQNARIREQFQRGLIDEQIKGLKLSAKDLIIHSDCDEIPRASTIQELAARCESNRYLLELDDFVYFLNLYQGKWARCTVTSFDRFKGVQYARQNMYVGHAVKYFRFNFPLMRVPDYWTTRRYLRFLPIIKYNPRLVPIEGGGWHFNNLFSTDDIIEKIKSFSHTELVKQVDLSRSNISNLRENRKNIFTNSNLKKVEMNESYPKFVLNNLDKFSNFILE